MKPTCRLEILQMIPKGSVGAEIGVEAGKFAKRILEIVQPSIYYMVDAWKVCTIAEEQSLKRTDSLYHGFLHDICARYPKEMAEGRIRVVCGKSSEVAEFLPDGTLDWVYIDADHTKEGCLKDLRAYVPKVKIGGIVAGHDYNFGPSWIGVREALEEFGAPKYEVTQDKRPSWWYVKP